MSLYSSHKGSQLIENPQAILRSQLNNSSSKMQYSFSQSQRFQDKSHLSSSPSKFYELPNLWTKKGVSIGKSHRTDFSKKNVNTPSPNKYQLENFLTLKKNNGITIGLGRQVVKFRDMFGGGGKKSPDFGSYHPQPVIYSRSVSIGQKLDNLDNKWLKQVPGPGNYPAYELTNKNNRKTVSKYLSAPTSTFSKQKRASLASNSIVPGPGRYQYRSQSFDSSLFEKPYASKFGTSERRSLAESALQTPGPGSYKAFSQFLK